LETETRVGETRLENFIGRMDQQSNMRMGTKNGIFMENVIEKMVQQENG
jgi:hypothetical protein